ncbi:MAG: STAS domain-containing protein [Oscillospiraceae bacterium]|nr:STAS domain-containing protein [Oscillospiraceae bacterium]
MLNITKNLEDTKLTVYLEGRLDTTTAPQLEESMKESINNVTELIMDFEKLEYISSAGLRVLLSCQKIMSKQGSMKVIHVSDLIKEIFEVTGFIDILTIE